MAASLTLDIGEDRILLETRSNVYHLDIFLPFLLIQADCVAQFNRRTKVSVSGVISRSAGIVLFVRTMLWCWHGSSSGDITQGRAGSSDLAEELLLWLAPWLPPWLTTFSISFINIAHRLIYGLQNVSCIHAGTVNNYLEHVQ